MYYLGIDLGGTNIKGAVVTEEGAILREESCPTQAEQGAEAVTDRIGALLRALAGGYAPGEIGGVGVGCPGTVDPRRGIVVYAVNLGWSLYDLRSALRKRTGFEVLLVNDANAAALGEAAAGCARNAESAVVLTLGTGLGGGVVLNGRLLTGYAGAASELGHRVIAEEGVPCSCGRRGCWEAYASATALIRQTREAMAGHPESLLHEVAQAHGGVDGQTAFLASNLGDAAAAAVVNQYIRYLSAGVANIINIFYPQVVALSGGIANQGEALLEPLRQMVAPQVYGGAYLDRHTQIVQCTLGYRAGVIGAALAAQQGCAQTDLSAVG